MGHDHLLQENGSQLVLEDGSGVLILEEDVPGVHPVNVHATQQILPTRRLVKRKYKFWLRGTVVQKIIIKLRNLGEYLKPIKIPPIPIKQLKQNIIEQLKSHLVQANIDWEHQKMADALKDPLIFLMILGMIERKVRKLGRR